MNVSDGRNLTTVQLEPLARPGLEERRPALAVAPFIDAIKKSNITSENININNAVEIRESLTQGYRTLDRGMKNYFSGIRVPTRDGIKMMQVRISGGDKPYLIWDQDLIHGRVSLPVMSITRQNEELYPEKFSTPHNLWFQKRFLDAEGTRIALSPRPLPTKVTYTLSIWAEFKRDLEFINYQIRTRFNPIAEFLIEDEKLRMSVILNYGGMTSAVDTDTPADQRANKRYDFSVTMEGYLPLPERIVPSILGRVVTLKDADLGDVLETVQGKLNLPSIHIRS